MRWFVAAVVALVLCSPAAAQIRILEDPGGRLGDYVSHYSQVSRSGETVIIDGPCLSACTMVLGYIPRARLCATPKARFGFHAALIIDQYGRYVGPSPEGTRLLMDTYPPNVRRWIAQRGGLNGKMIYARARELGVRACA